MATAAPADCWTRFWKKPAPAGSKARIVMRFFAGLETFDQLEEDQLGTFYLTDFLARHFQTMVIEPLGLDWHPHLRDMYFRPLHPGSLPGADR
jgi:hypothetical protein